MPKSHSAPRETGKQPLYDEILVEVFRKHYQEGATFLTFNKDELAEACRKRGVTIRNIPDIVYSYRSRKSLPPEISATGHWVIESAGRGVYAFRLLQYPPHFNIPFQEYQPIDIYNAIPEVVEGLLRRDEQSLLTRVLYNRLIDIFTGLTCFHIQNHYRSFIASQGEVEVDALYVGVDNDGNLYILPVEAKSQAETEMVGRFQVSQMNKLARQDFPQLGRRILAVKELLDETIVVTEFSDHDNPNEIKIVSVRRFRLFRRGSS